MPVPGIGKTELDKLMEENFVLIDCRNLTWIQLRKLILLRDQNICQDCGENAGRSHVHHIDFNRIHNLPVNLISLCRGCHEKRHMLRKHLDLKKIPLIKKLLLNSEFTMAGDLAPLLGVTQPSISEFIDKIPQSFTRLNNLTKVINTLLDSDYTIEELFTLVDID